MKQAHFYAYGIIGEPDTFFQLFTGEQEPTISAQKITEFLNANADADELIFHIKSRGGNYTEGFTIYDLLTTSGKKITTIGEGEVASIATVMFMAGSTRELLPNTQPLIHNPWVDPKQLGDSLTADELQALANEMKSAETKLLDFYVQKTGADRATLQSLMQQDMAMTAEKAIELKIATGVKTPTKALAYIPNKKVDSNQIQNQMKTLLQRVEDLYAQVVQGKKKPEADNASGAKSFTAKTSDGKTITIGDSDGDGEPQVGDPVTDEAGAPIVSATISLEDGTTLKTDASGNISEVTPDAGDGTAAADDTADVAALKAENDSLKNEVKDLKDAQAIIENKLTAIARNIQSNYVLKDSKTNLNRGGTGAAGKKPTLKELRAQRAEEEKKK